MDVLVVQRVLRGLSGLWAFPGVAVNVLLCRAELFGAVCDVSCSQVRDSGSTGETGDPVFYIARNVFVGDVLLDSFNDLQSTLVEALVRRVSGSGIRRVANFDVARPLGTVSGTADANGDQGVVLVGLRLLVPDVD